MRRTVLLVEDEAKLADVLAEQLGEEGFDVRRASSLRQALRLLDDLVPDVAVIDIGLPDGSGLDVLRRLRCGADRLDSGTPGARADRAHGGGRRPTRLRAGRGRLPAQAVRAARADRARACAAGARPPGARRHPRRRPAARAVGSPGQLGRAPSCRSRAASTTCCSSSHAILERCARKPTSCARSGACRRRCARAPSIRTPAACGASSSPPARRRIRSSTSGGGATASKSLVRFSVPTCRSKRACPSPSPSSLRWRWPRSGCSSWPGIHDRVAREGRASLARTLAAASPGAASGTRSRGRRVRASPGSRRSAQAAMPS